MYYIYYVLYIIYVYIYIYIIYLHLAKNATGFGDPITMRHAKGESTRWCLEQSDRLCPPQSNSHRIGWLYLAV